MKNLKKDIIIIGAGAAGLMAAYYCSLGKKNVLVLEHNKQVGRKILISGGGRCNFTNISSGPNDFESLNPHFCKSALSRYTPQDFIDFVEKNKIDYFEKKLGQLFCQKSAKDIVNALLNQLQKDNVEILLNQKDLEIEDKGDGFIIQNNEITAYCDDLIIATGGLSIPPIGATDFGHKVARRYGHKVRQTTPALVGLKLDEFSDLSGVSIVATVNCGRRSIREDVLITHKGLSGPAILKISLYHEPGDDLIINWLNEESIDLFLKKHPGGSLIHKALKKYLPDRFVDFILRRQDIAADKKIAELSKKERQSLHEGFCHMVLKPTGTEGFRKAEVTKGGIDTTKISSKTMQSSLRSNLYFIGEVLDVTGQLGGHNFQWAWASAFAAGDDLK